MAGPRRRLRGPGHGARRSRRRSMVTIGTLSGCPWRRCWTSRPGCSTRDCAARWEPPGGPAGRGPVLFAAADAPRWRRHRSPCDQGNGRRARLCSSPVGDTHRARFSLSVGFLQRTYRSRRPRHGRRSRDRQYARLCAGSRHRALGALGGGDRRPLGRGPRGRPRGQAHARPHARHDPGDPAAQGRGDRRLRRHRADAPALHPEGPPEPLGAPARGGLRALRSDRRREARGRGSLPVRRRPPGLSDRGADGGRDRRGLAGRRADRQHRRRHRRRHERGGGDLAGRDRRLAVDPRRRRRDGRRRSSTT